jgi:hypothetical protein
MDVNFTIHFIIVLARPPLLWQEHACMGAGAVKNIKGVSMRAIYSFPNLCPREDFPRAPRILSVALL